LHALRRPLSFVLFPPSPLRASCSNFKDSCTQRVRSAWFGVTRIPATAPLVAFAPSRSSSLRLGLLTEASSHGLQHVDVLGPKSSSIVMLALQSFKEPRE
jgi:hypothetical protein